MIKSLGKPIGITEPPNEIFGKAMSVPDEMMREYYQLALAYEPARLAALEAEIKSGALHPRDAKARMARELVERYHGAAAGAEAEAHFNRVFREKSAPEQIETAELAAPEGKMRLIDAMAAAGLAASKAEARRLIAQGGVTVDERRAESDAEELRSGEYLVKVGKRRFKRIRLT